MNIANLVTQAVDVAARYGQQMHAVPDEARPTLPSIEVHSDGKQALLIAYHHGDPRPPGPSRPRKITFPFYEVKVTLPEMQPSGRRITAKDFGLDIPAEQSIGDLGDLLRFDMRGYRERKERYFELLSSVVENRWLLPHPGRAAMEVQTANEIAKVLNDIREKALEPYYRVAMRDLRAWLEAVLVA